LIATISAYSGNGENDDDMRLSGVKTVSTVLMEKNIEKAGAG
jgi:hypothetical protein